MQIVKVEKTKNYTVMSNYHFQEKEMSLKAKGLLSLMLSLPDNWNYSIEGLVSICKENETSIKSALNELKEFGYLKVIKKMPNETESGRIEYEYIIYEQKQAGEKQGLENLPLENQGQLNTNNIYDSFLINNNLTEYNNHSDNISIDNITDKKECVLQENTLAKKSYSNTLFSKNKTSSDELKSLLSNNTGKKEENKNRQSKHSSILNNLKINVSKLNETEDVKKELYRWLDILDCNNKIVSSEQMYLALEYLNKSTKDDEIKIEAIKLASMNAYRNFNYTIDEAKKNLNKVVDFMHHNTGKVRNIDDIAREQAEEFSKYIEEHPEEFKDIPEYF